MSAVQFKALLNAVCQVDNACTFIVHDQILIRGLDYKKRIVLQYSQVPCASKFLTNLKIRHLLRNVLKLNFFVHLAWTILKDLVSWYVFTQKIFYSIVQGIILPYLVEYIKMLTIFQQ